MHRLTLSTTQSESLTNKNSIQLLLVLVDGAPGVLFLISLLSIGRHEWIWPRNLKSWSRDISLNTPRKFDEFSIKSHKNHKLSYFSTVLFHLKSRRCMLVSSCFFQQQIKAVIMDYTTIKKPTTHPETSWQKARMPGGCGARWTGLDAHCTSRDCGRVLVHKSDTASSDACFET